MKMNFFPLYICAVANVIQSSFSNQSRGPSSSTNVEPLPHGIPLKPIVKVYKREFYHLKKKLKKMEDELQKSRKNAFEATIEVSHLRKLHMKDFTSFNIKKGNFKRELAKLKKSASDKSWVLTIKISSLKAELRAVRDQIQLLKGSSPWSIDKAQYEWDWS